LQFRSGMRFCAAVSAVCAAREGVVRSSDGSIPRSRAEPGRRSRSASHASTSTSRLHPGPPAGDQACDRRMPSPTRPSRGARGRPACAAPDPLSHNLARGRLGYSFHGDARASRNRRGLSRSCTPGAFALTAATVACALLRMFEHGAGGGAVTENELAELRTAPDRPSPVQCPRQSTPSHDRPGPPPLRRAERRVVVREAFKRGEAAAGSR
jgi:hypothetical protein